MVSSNGSYSLNSSWFYESTSICIYFIFSFQRQTLILCLFYFFYVFDICMFYIPIRPNQRFIPSNRFHSLVTKHTNVMHDANSYNNNTICDRMEIFHLLKTVCAYLYNNNLCCAYRYLPNYNRNKLPIEGYVRRLEL